MVDWAPRLGTAAEGYGGQKQLLRRQGRRAPETGAVRGQFKSAEGLVFLTLRDAGHLAPMDQPEVTLAMVRCVCLLVAGMGPISRYLAQSIQRHIQAIHAAGRRGLRADGRSGVCGGGRRGRCTGGDVKRERERVYVRVE